MELLEYSIGIEIGGTKIASGIVARLGEILEKVVIFPNQKLNSFFFYKFNL